MNKEKKLINLIAKIMPWSDAQLNKLFESDSEILKFGQRNILFTIDEFSKEDMLREHDPYILGWNLAVGGISDILASGGRPLFYAHSFVINRNWTEDYIKEFCSGVADVLKESDTFFIGGDLGQADDWSYTIACIGEIIDKPILRTSAKNDNLIYLSGEIGAGNLEALLKLQADKKVKNRFYLRIKESALLSKFATSCIDTSDGVFNALETLAEMSNLGYEVTNLPYLKTDLIAKIPEILLFLGECGEYELLFTIKKEDELKFLREAKRQNLYFYKIGQMSSKEKKNLKNIDLSKINIRARDFADVKDYLKELQQCIKF